ncbi:MAG: DUF983 domain-containing protein [Flavobacteriales bacterium]|jgi:uncharacterized protein (DUF983 family)
MLKKGTKLFSILKRKCPHCQEGEFFVSGPYNFKNLGKVHESCSVCKESFSKEPGFYYGAMYVSYALGVAVFVAVFLLTYLFYPNPGAFEYILFIGIAMVVLGPFLYSLSKIIWANLFMSYKKKI